MKVEQGFVGGRFPRISCSFCPDQHPSMSNICTILKNVNYWTIQYNHCKNTCNEMQIIFCSAQLQQWCYADNYFVHSYIYIVQCAWYELQYAILSLILWRRSCTFYIFTSICSSMVCYLVASLSVSSYSTAAADRGLRDIIHCIIQYIILWIVCSCLYTELYMALYSDSFLLKFVRVLYSTLALLLDFTVSHCQCQCSV